MNEQFTRRTFLAATAAPVIAHAAEKPAVLGGKPAHPGKFHPWPVFDKKEEDALVEVVRSGKWGRGKQVAAFEAAWAKATGAKYCLATTSGTTALFNSLNAVGIGPGDEVIVPPYTFEATVNVVMLHHALPVFADTDPETSQIAAASIEPKITPQTRLVIPVHYGGNPADLDAVLAVAKKHKLHVVEDACQAHLAAWRGRNVGNWGTLGCFSFQATKNLNTGDGGAIITNSEEMMSRCYSFHNVNRSWRGGEELKFASTACNLRMTEFHAAVLLSQLARLEEQSRRREQNAGYLDGLLREIPGVKPRGVYPGCTRHNQHTYSFRYAPQQFAGMSKPQLIKALNAEGIPFRGGYTALNKAPYIKRVLQGPIYRRLYSKQRIAQWFEQNECPGNEELMASVVVFSHELLLSSRAEMDQIAAGVRKVQAHAAAIVKMS